jgi:hypothetical protein
MLNLMLMKNNQSWSEEHNYLVASFSSFDGLSFEGDFCSHVVFPLS